MMIRSSNVTTKFSNTNRLEALKSFQAEYSRVVSLVIDKLWDLDKVPALPGKEFSQNVTDCLSARIVSRARNQASAIVRGTQQKQKQRLWKIQDFKVRGMFKKARILQAKYDVVKCCKPVTDELPIELCSAFINIDLDNTTSFDGWLTIFTFKDKQKIIIPFKRTKHFNRMLDLGKLKPCARVTSKSVTFMFDLDEPKLRKTGKILGIDVGQISILACSDGQQVDVDTHGHSYQSICDKLARKRKGSHNFKQAQAHRSNFIHWAVKQLNLSNIKIVNVEQFKNFRLGKRSKSRSLFHWNNTELSDTLEARLYSLGVQVCKVSPTYTSQRCSMCGWVRKENRSGKWFKCTKCSFEHDADLNAAKNISLQLQPITAAARLKRANVKGFYWPVLSEAHAVPHAIKQDDLLSFL